MLRVGRTAVRSGAERSPDPAGALIAHVCGWRCADRPHASGGRAVELQLEGRSASMSARHGLAPWAVQRQRFMAVQGSSEGARTKVLVYANSNTERDGRVDGKDRRARDAERAINESCRVRRVRLTLTTAYGYALQDCTLTGIIWMATPHECPSAPPPVAAAAVKTSSAAVCVVALEPPNAHEHGPIHR